MFEKKRLGQEIGRVKSPGRRHPPGQQGVLGVVGVRYGWQDGGYGEGGTLCLMTWW